MKFSLGIIVVVSSSVGYVLNLHREPPRCPSLTFTKAIAQENTQLHNEAMRILCFLGFCSLMTPGFFQAQKTGLSTVAQWHGLDYDFGSYEARDQAIADRSFVPGNGIPIDIDMNYKPNGQSRMFITVPRFQTGIPSTLNTVKKNSTNFVDPLLKPYPALHWHQNSAECRHERLVSVFRIQIDECNRLWVLDAGKVGSNQLCNPQILAFDLRTDRVVYRYEIPRSQIRSTSILVTPVVDVRDAACSDTFVYAADVTGFGIIVLDVRRNTSWRVMNKLMYPVPDFGTFTIENESFDLMDGVLGMSISPYRPGEDRVLFFHALASNTENWVRTSLLRNFTAFMDNEEAQPRSFVQIPRKRSTQSAAAGIDRNGIMYFGLLGETSMACWNTNQGNAQYGYQNNLDDVLERNPETLQFTSGVKIVNNLKGGQEVWVSSCRFQKVMTGTIDQRNDINFRIQAVKIENFVSGSKCQGYPSDKPQRPQGNGGGYGLIPPQQPVWSRSALPEQTNTAAIKRSALYDPIVFLDE